MPMDSSKGVAPRIRKPGDAPGALSPDPAGIVPGRAGVVGEFERHAQAREDGFYAWLDAHHIEQGYEQFGGELTQVALCGWMAALEWQAGHALRPRQGWQPIETAPKDGTLILLGRFVKGCKWDRTIETDYWHRRPKHNYEGWGEFNASFWPPTHWMPLPEPPA